MLSLEPWTLFWTLLNVLVLFFVLKKFLIKPVMGVIQKREDMINQQFESARETQSQADQMKQEYEEQLATAQNQATDIIQAARIRAEEEHAQAVARTQKESEQMMEKARKNIKLEQEQAKSELQSQIADIAMLAARKIIKTGEVHDTGSNE